MLKLHRSTSLFNRNADLEMLATQVSDYAAVGRALFVQRSLIFGAALVLQAVYISTIYAGVCLLLIALAEAYDSTTFHRAKHMDPKNAKEVRTMLCRIHIGAVMCSGVIGFFTVSISVLQTSDNYFMPLFFLLAAAIFAAMNNNQIVTVLAIRLVLYGITFLVIPLRDLMQSGVPLSDERWLNFFTSVFVLYFIVDFSMTTLRYYRSSKHHLKQLGAENERARAALGAKTEFLSTVSHELRTPLTSIKAALDMTMAGAFGPLPEKSTGVLKIAQRNAGRLTQLINELLDLQKMEIGKMKFNFQRVDIACLLADALSGNRSFADDLGVKLKMTPVDTDLAVHGDRMRLEQVITNLLSNAAKFSPAGSEVRLSVEVQDGRVRINVCDQGVGIAEADRNRIFESFSQLDASDRRKVGGTGLGLNISKRIVEAHSGEIDFASNADGGTTFYVLLDQAAPTAKTEQTEDLTPAERRAVR